MTSILRPEQSNNAYVNVFEVLPTEAAASLSASVRPQTLPGRPTDGVSREVQQITAASSRPADSSEAAEANRRGAVLAATLNREYDNTHIDGRAIAEMSSVERLQTALTMAKSKVGPELAAEIDELLKPENLAILGSVLIAWGGAHAFGAGQAADVAMLAAAVGFGGTNALKAINHLARGAVKALGAKTRADFDGPEGAATRFAQGAIKAGEAGLSLAPILGLLKKANNLRSLQLSLAPRAISRPQQTGTGGEAASSNVATSRQAATTNAPASSSRTVAPTSEGRTPAAAATDANMTPTPEARTAATVAVPAPITLGTVQVPAATEAALDQLRERLGNSSAVGAAAQPDSPLLEDRLQQLPGSMLNAALSGLSREELTRMWRNMDQRLAYQQGQELAVHIPQIERDEWPNPRLRANSRMRFELSPREIRQYESGLNGDSFVRNGAATRIDAVAEQERFFRFVAQNATSENLMRIFLSLGDHPDAFRNPIRLETTSIFMHAVRVAAPQRVSQEFFQRAASHPHSRAIEQALEQMMRSTRETAFRIVKRAEFQSTSEEAIAELEEIKARGVEHISYSSENGVADETIPSAYVALSHLSPGVDYLTANIIHNVSTMARLASLAETYSNVVANDLHSLDLNLRSGYSDQSIDNSVRRTYQHVVQTIRRPFDEVSATSWNRRQDVGGTQAEIDSLYDERTDALNSTLR